MSAFARAFLRQVTPPILVNVARRLFRPKLAVADETEVRVLREAFYKRNASSAPNEITMRDGISLKIHPDSRYGFEYFCFVDPVMVRELDCFIAKTENCQRLLDVGALHGIFSLVFAQRVAKSALAVDASPLAFGRLLYNSHKHSLQNITAVECALSDRPGVLKMHYEWEHAVSGQTNLPDEQKLSVEMITGDQLCATRQFSPDAIKIDVEGHEVRVIRGLKDTITKNRPLLFLEIHPTRIADHGDDISESAQFLKSLGYGVVNLDGSKLEWDALPQLRVDTRVVAECSR